VEEKKKEGTNLSASAKALRAASFSATSNLSFSARVAFKASISSSALREGASNLELSS